MDKSGLTDDLTNPSDRRQPLKTTVSMPILGQRTAAVDDGNRRDRRQPIGKPEEMSSLPDSGDDDDLGPRPALTKSTSCYVQQTGALQPRRPTADRRPEPTTDETFDGDSSTL